jgi:hypothetical protein
MCRVWPFICGNLVTNSVVRWPTGDHCLSNVCLIQPNFQQMEVVSLYAGQLRMCPLLVHPLVCWAIKLPVAVKCVNVTFIQALELYECFTYASDDVWGIWDKAVQLWAWTGRCGCRRLRAPHEGDKVVRPWHRPPLSLGDTSCTHFC